MKRVLVLCLVLVVTACSESPTAKAPSPREPDATTVGHICGMFLAEHPGPKGQVYAAGESEPLWFSSVRDTLAYLRGGDDGKPVAAAYVNDMARADWERPQGAWVEARKALYVIGSRRAGGMGEAEVVPFGDRRAAEAFVAQYGGRVVDYDQVPNEYIFYGKLAETQKDGG